MPDDLDQWLSLIDDENVIETLMRTEIIGVSPAGAGEPRQSAEEPAADEPLPPEECLPLLGAASSSAPGESGSEPMEQPVPVHVEGATPESADPNAMEEPAQATVDAPSGTVAEAAPAAEEPARATRDTEVDEAVVEPASVEAMTEVAQATEEPARAPGDTDVDEAATDVAPAVDESAQAPGETKGDEAGTEPASVEAVTDMAPAVEEPAQAPGDTGVEETVAQPAVVNAVTDVAPAVDESAQAPDDTEVEEADAQPASVEGAAEAARVVEEPAQAPDDMGVDESVAQPVSAEAAADVAQVVEESALAPDDTEVDQAVAEPASVEAVSDVAPAMEEPGRAPDDTEVEEGVAQPASGDAVTEAAPVVEEPAQAPGEAVAEPRLVEEPAAAGEAPTPHPLAPAVELLRAGDYERAGEAFWNAIESKSHPALASLGLGACLLHMAQPEAALRTFEDAMHFKQPGGAAGLTDRARFGTALAKLQLGRPKLAEDALSRVAVSHIDGVEMQTAWMGLGAAYYEAGEYGDAARAFERAEALGLASDDLRARLTAARGQAGSRA